MRSRLIILFLITIFSASVQAQVLSGKVTNMLNEPVVGASIKVVGGTRGTTTNVEGRYSISLPEAKAYEIEISAIGYVSKIISDIERTNGSLAELNVTLESRTTEMEGITVSARRTSARLESTASVIQFQKNTNTVASVVAAEAIRRSPDKNTGEVLKRTPGASLQDGRFLIVRGLADRYNQAMMNGVLLTSSEPDRKTFSFDLIPSQIIDNIIINKAFVPEYPGEWSGGLIQVNTKDIPTKNFLTIQAGTGYNTQSNFKKFYREAQGGKTDWLGVDDGTRALPYPYTNKSSFDTASRALRTQVGKNMRNSWVPEELTAPLNYSFQVNGGFSGRLFKKRAGAALGLSYSRNYRTQLLLNRKNIFNEHDNNWTIEQSFDDDKYITETTLGGIGSFAIELNSLNKISFKSILNVSGDNNTIRRDGYDISRGDDKYIRASEFTFKQHTFFTSQLIGEHGFTNDLRFKWYGSFNVLDAYSPDQRRLQNTSRDQTNYMALLSNVLVQNSGSRVYQSLNDYIYTAGGELGYNFKAFNNLSQNIKTGYMLQIKDRLYDAQLFANYLPSSYNKDILELPADKIFAPENFGNGYDNLLAFDAIKNRNFRYLANTILNAGFIQFDNQLSPMLRVVWGLRVENFDQLVGSVKKWDPRHTHTNVTDFLPGINATYKLNNKTNIRLSASQTVIRPELRELSALNLYDFDLNASIQGNPNLKRSKILNTDLRYEVYPRAGETFNAGVFYKNFKDPIEQFYNDGAGGSSTFNYQNLQRAYSVGLEVELRKKLDMIDVLRNFTFQSNVSIIRSRIEDTLYKVERPLQGQSDYLVNAGLLYDHEKTGLNITTLFNIIGKRIYLVGDINANAPDIYEAPRALLDLQVAKKVLDKKGELKLTISDILNRTQYFYQNIPGTNLGLDKGVDAYRFTRKFGTTFNLTFSYTL